MKHTSRLFVLLAAIMMVTACKGTKKITETDTQEKETIQKITLYNKPFEDLKSDSFEIDSLAVENKTLAVFVSYGGGCGNTGFEMYYKPQMMTLMPHRASLFLTCEDNDPCRSIVSKKLLFDLSAFNKEMKTGVLLLDVNGKELTYQVSEE